MATGSVAGRWNPLLCLPVILFVMPLSIARRSDQREEAQALINRARSLSDIRAPGASTFRLRGQIRVQNLQSGGVEDGTYLLIWVSPDQWREEVSLPGLQLLQIRVKDSIWSQGTSRFPPPVVERVRGALNFPSRLKLNPRASVEKPKHVEDEGLSLESVHVRTNQWPRHSNHWLWFNSNDGTLVKEQVGEWQYHYSKYERLGDKLYPWLLACNEGGSITAEVLVSDLSFQPSPAPSLFIPPAGSEKWPVCGEAERVTPPVPLKRTNPPYPQDLLGQHAVGIVKVDVIIGTDGRVVDVELAGPANPEFASITLKTIREEWQFRPATCGGLPIPAYSEVKVNFQFH